MNAAISAVIERVDAACPCIRMRYDWFGDSRNPDSCPCSNERTPELSPLIGCRWPGHAAIREAVEIALEEAAKLIDVIGPFKDGSAPDIEFYPADAIRALLPRKEGR